MSEYFPILSILRVMRIGSSEALASAGAFSFPAVYGVLQCLLNRKMFG
ncbi:hypothetical protein [Pseudomonas phage vB_Pae_CF23a]|nr:hypothetical protein [Pseudomonas phage vB_Pae_CF23a]QBI80003.1 hypothetical protein [Pseudomonas phage vB_Pae_CF57a]QBI80092.1 hypothetical protein [Pseudomonas phage vB_Pae_CF65a]QBI80230.1 hypothetical protein [Pseudomonas phage vB_Pae_CF81a]QBI80317.1 hypothetical protein [Pseudomonas phage vB_Pae_CF118a]QBI80515.1 hypothetical protein [Pseudomonas phage vB_Pae_CF136b]QBI80567.1 hypothetical protein [Pseudomonas phage vB_Pae_CF177c]QBI80654.1 hypothetical protein [Pseudomonas phage vB